MGRTKQAFIAATCGYSFTMYAVMKAMGLPLSPEQEKFQAYLERTYPAIVVQEGGSSESEGTDKDSAGH